MITAGKLVWWSDFSGIRSGVVAELSPDGRTVMLIDDADGREYHVPSNILSVGVAPDDPRPPSLFPGRMGAHRPSSQA